MTRQRFLVTGATGNVGREVLDALAPGPHDVVAGLRNPARWTRSGVGSAEVDLESGRGPEGPFDAIFLMRPPQVADPAPFRAFLDLYDRATRIVFLSVAGAERKSYLPHAKIEAGIRDMGFPHVFVRPGYFMENLTTTLAEELGRSGRIVLPAGRLAFDWVSARDVATMVAHALVSDAPPEALRVTTGRGLGFGAALEIVNGAAGTAFRYAPKSVLGYVRHARRNGADWPFVAVMLLLHTLPRLSGEKPEPGDVDATLGRPPESLADWAARNAETLRAL